MQLRDFLPKIVRFSDSVYDTWSRDIRGLLERLVAHPSADGRYVVNSRGSLDIVLTNGATNKFQHGLNRPLVGWRVMDLRGASATGRIVRLPANDSTDLWLDVQGWGANIIVRLWVE